MGTIKIAKLEDGAKLPTRKNITDAGLDLYAYIKNSLDSEFNAETNEVIYFEWLAPLDVKVFRTGVTAEIPPGYFGWITNKSKNDFIIGGGIVDEGYQGELLIKIINTTNSPIKITNGQAIAQLLIVPCETLRIEETPLDRIHKVKTARGTTGGVVTQIEAFAYNPDDGLWDVNNPPHTGAS